MTVNSILVDKSKKMLENISPTYLCKVYNFLKKAPKIEKISPEEEKELQEIEAAMDAGEYFTFDEV